jgi:hypothetical protein
MAKTTCGLGSLQGPRNSSGKKTKNSENNHSNSGMAKTTFDFKVGFGLTKNHRKTTEKPL